MSDMRVDNKHVYTAGENTTQDVEAQKLSETFQKTVSVPKEEGKPLNGRVTIGAVERKPVFTAEISDELDISGLPELFQENVLFDTNSPSLNGKIDERRNVTERGDLLSIEVGNTARKIPTYRSSAK
jgi:hypothetical protein